MARLTTTGFEQQTTSNNTEWNEFFGSPTLSSTVYYGGSRSLRISSLVSATRQGALRIFESTGSGTYYARMMFRVDTAPSAENRIMFVTSGTTTSGTQALYITIDNSRVIRLYAGGSLIATSSAISTGRFHRIEWFMRGNSASLSQAELRINGTQVGSTGTGLNMVALVSLVIGGNLNTEAQTTGDWFFDDIAINDNTGTSGEGGYPGDDMAVLALPTGAGDNNEWRKSDGTTAGDANNYTEVDEITPDSTTTFLTRNSSAQPIDDFNVTNTATLGINSTDRIKLIHVGAQVGANSGTANAAREITMRIKSASGGTVQSQADHTCNVNGFTYIRNNQPKNYGLTSYTDPTTGVAWTPTGTNSVENMQIGIRPDTLATTYVRYSAIWAYISYLRPPTIVLNTADGTSTSDTTPTLEFTGTDSDSDDLRYNIQIHSANTFGAGPTYDTAVNGSGNGVNNFNFSSLTTAETNEVLIATIHASNNTPSGVTFSGGGLSWTQIGSEQTIINGGKVWYYYAVASSTLSGVTITATFTGGGFPQASGSIIAIKGADTSSPIGNHTIVPTTVTANILSGSAVVSSPKSMIITGMGQTGGNAFTAGVGQTLVGQSAAGLVSRCATSYANSTNVFKDDEIFSNPTIASSDDWAIRIIEVKAASVPLLDKVSGTDAGFANTVTGADTDPFNSGEKASYTVQSVLSDGTYYWRVRAKDPNNQNTYSDWSSTYSIVISTVTASPTAQWPIMSGGHFRGPRF